MFTGLIEETGTLQNLNRGSASCVLTVGCREVLENTKIGDSIAVNGVCLTVTSLGSNYFTADAKFNARSTENYCTNYGRRRIP